MRRYLIFPLTRFIVSGNSMLPNLKPKTSVIAYNWYYFFSEPKPNEIVVAKINNRLMIKRIKKVNNGKVWLEGDNPKESTDSRNFGWINKSQIIGKIIYTI